VCNERGEEGWTPGLELPVPPRTYCRFHRPYKFVPGCSTSTEGQGRRRSRRITRGHKKTGVPFGGQ